MDTPPRAEDRTDAGRPWLRRSGFFEEIVGFTEAQEVLADGRFEADLIGLFEGLGVTSGPFWEITKASLLSLNGEQHRKIRSLVAGMFTPRSVEAARPAAGVAADELVAHLSTVEPVDFIAAFATPYVARGTCSHIGFPVADADRCAAALHRIGAGTRDLANRLDDCTEGVLSLVSYAREVLDERRRAPREDVLSVLAAHVDDGEIPEDVALTLVATLMSAGHEPTVNQLGLAMLSLSTRPDLWEALADGSLPLSRGVEELLRFRSTNQGMNRRVSEPVEYCGHRFTAGHQILVSITEANHDPAHFQEPDALDPEANKGPHLAFGFGAHYCLGAALARVQLQEALRALTSTRSCPVVIESQVHDGTGLLAPTRLILSLGER